MPRHKSGSDRQDKPHSAYARGLTGRKNMENALRESEERYRAIFENSTEAIILGSPDGGVYAANDEACRIFGITREELVHMGRDGVMDASDPRLPLAIAERERTGKFKGELNLRRKDGTVFPGEVSTAFFTDRDGLTKTTIIVRDITGHKLAEEALRQSETNLSAFFNTITDLLFVVDMGGNIITTNDTAAERLGYTREELAGNSLLMLHPVERRMEAREVFKTILEGRATQCPLALVTKDGRHIPVETRAVKGKWNGQDVIFGVSKDISKLKLSEEKFFKTFHASAALMAISTFDEGRIVDVNETLLATLGYRREELIGRTSVELQLLPDPSQRTRMLEEVRRKGRVANYEVSFRTRCGEICHGLLFAESLFIQDVPYLSVTVNDITERKQIEDALKESERKYRLLAENMGDVIWMLDLESGRLDYISPSVEKLRGFTPEQVMGQTMEETLTPESYRLVAESLPPRLAAFAAGDESARIDTSEVDQVKRDGSVVPVEVVTTLLTDAEGQVTGMLGVSRDITVRKQAQVELEKHKNHLEALVFQRTFELEEKSRHLEDANAALRALLSMREQDNKTFGEKVVLNVRELILPYLDRLKNTSGEPNVDLIDILEANLNDIISPFMKTVASLSFTPTEAEIANLIRNGKSIKEIANLLHVSPRSVERHRYNIRKKLKLTNEKVNLYSYLLSIG